MSWGAIPFFVYALEAEQHEALISGAMPEELNAGYTRSCPDHWIRMFRERWTEDEYRLYSLGVRIG